MLSDVSAVSRWEKNLWERCLGFIFVILMLLKCRKSSYIISASMPGFLLTHNSQSLNSLIFSATMKMTVMSD